MTDAPEPFATLLQRYQHDREAGGDAEPGLARISLSEALGRGDDPLHILPYLAELGLVVNTLEDLLLINQDGTEEELHSFRVAEGVAVSVASEGAWLLFEP